MDSKQKETIHAFFDVAKTYLEDFQDYQKQLKKPKNKKRFFDRVKNDNPSHIYDNRTIAFTKEELESLKRYVVKYESLDGTMCGQAGGKIITIFDSTSLAKVWIDTNRKKGFVYMIIETY